MSKTSAIANPDLDVVLQDLATRQEFRDLDFEDALIFFCKTLSSALDAPRVGIWTFNETATELESRLLWDQKVGVVTQEIILTSKDASSYLEAVRDNIVVIVDDAAKDPRCVELKQDYLPVSGVSALLDCPIRTFGGLAGVICIEAINEPRKWSSKEVNFALAVSGLVSLAFEHNERSFAERAASEHREKLKLYTDLATDWFWETDAEFRFESLHGSAAVDGQTPADYIGKKLWTMEILTPLEGNWDRLKERVREEKRIYDFVVSASDEDGKTYYAEIAGLPKYDADGTFVGYWGTAKDVSSRVQRELDLAASEQKYQSASRIAKLGSWIWDQRTDACSYCSPELAAIYGVSVKEYLARTRSSEMDLDWFHPDDRAHYTELVRAAAESGTGYETTVRIIRDDGSVRTLHENTEPVFDSSGRFVATAGVLQDITEQVELRSQLKDHEDRLKGIIDNIPGAVYRAKFDESFTSVFRSSQYLSLFVDPSLPALEETVPENIPALQIRRSDRLRIDKILKAAIAQNSAYELEYSVTLRDGTEKWVSDRGRPVMSHDGEIELEGIMIDVTEKQAAREALAHAQRLEAIGKLTGGVAHDFNNLLAVILGNLELLRDQLSAPSQVDLVDAGIRSVHRGADLTRNMLAFARKSRLNLEILDLNGLAENSKNWIGRTLPGNISVRTSLAPGLWKTETDASSAESALINLILNARDAMPEGGNLMIETSNIRIDESFAQGRGEDIEPGRYVVLSVSDTGDGIPADNLADIFEPFFSTKAPGSGSGLGLSMVMGFLKQSGGFVRVHSDLGKGTTFKLFFKASGAESENIRPRQRSSSALPTGSARIMVVEDENAVREVLAATLTQAGYSIATAASGDEAREIFAATPDFDLLLTDVMMPGTLSGPMLARELCSRAPGLRVVFLSGYASDSSEMAIESRPEDMTLMKPVGRLELLNAIQKTLGFS